MINEQQIRQVRQQFPVISSNSKENGFTAYQFSPQFCKERGPIQAYERKTMSTGLSRVHRSCKAWCIQQFESPYTIWDNDSFPCSLSGQNRLQAKSFENIIAVPKKCSHQAICVTGYRVVGILLISKAESPSFQILFLLLLFPQSER